MLRSLRFRLLLMMVIVLSLAVGVVAVLAREASTRQFYRYVQYDNASRLERFSSMLATYYNQQLGWQDVQPLVKQMGEISGARVALVDNDGNVIAASSNDLVGKNLEISPEGSVEVRLWVRDDMERRQLMETGGLPEDLQSHNKSVGAVYIDPNIAGEQSFEGSVTRSLLMAVIAAGLIAMLMTVTLARRIFEPVEALTNAARLMAKGDLAHRVSVHAKNELGELASAFNAMADGLFHLEMLRRNMVSDIAHELRTPLSNLRGYLEAIQDGIVEPSPRTLDSMYEEVLLLSHLIDDLQELALAEAGQLRLNVRALELPGVMHQAVDVLNLKAMERQLQIDLDIPQDLPPVHGDAKRISQVMRNLLNNAVTHTPDGGRINLSVRRVGTELEVRVKDTGTGIAPEHLSDVFERFYRVDQSRSRNTGGAGLGLAIVKQLIQAHGGRVWAESLPGKGSTFAFTLPVRHIV